MQKVLGPNRCKYMLEARPSFPCGLQDNSGSVEFKEIYAHSSKYGGMALSPEELKAVFQDFDTSGDSMVSADEFLTFFSRTLTHCSNKEFDEMMKEMLD
jgi:Ca2+-binding EF-hand superfamily protein